MKEKIKSLKNALLKSCENLFSISIRNKIKKVVNKILDVGFIRKPLRRVNTFLRLLVQIVLGCIYICIFMIIFSVYHNNHTFPDPNRPNVSLAQIQNEEYQAKKKAEADEKARLEREKEEFALAEKERLEKEEADKKAKLEKEEAEKKAIEEAKKQEEQKKLEEEQKVQEANKKGEEERLQQERQAKAEQENRQAQQVKRKAQNNQIQQSGGGYWIAAYGGNVYHSRPNCRHMNHPIEINLNYIQTNGLRPCKNCHH